MIEYLKRKLLKVEKDNFKPESYPIYYEQNGKLIKELENGQKFEIVLDKDHNEQIVGEYHV